MTVLYWYQFGLLTTEKDVRREFCVYPPPHLGPSSRWHGSISSAQWIVDVDVGSEIMYSQCPSSIVCMC